MHLEKAPSKEPFGIYHEFCSEHKRKEILVYNGNEVYIMCFDSQDEYRDYMEFTKFAGKVVNMLDEFFSQNPPL